MVAPKEPWQQHTSSEVEAMTPEQAMAVREAGARYQRGRPESAMNRIQERSGGGVFSHAVEHVGDLTHRMNEMEGRAAAQTVRPKIRSMHHTLHHGYGFEREHEENIVSNARYKGEDPDTLRSDVRALSQTYADEHRKVPVYNYPSEVARDAAVSLGEHRFDDARRSIGVLSAMEFGGRDPDGFAWDEGDMMGLLRERSNQGGMVDYLRNKEARTPALTDAATVMVGGKLQR